MATRTATTWYMAEVEQWHPPTQEWRPVNEKAVKTSAAAREWAEKRLRNHVAGGLRARVMRMRAVPASLDSTPHPLGAHWLGTRPIGDDVEWVWVEPGDTP
ncbi:hypothetical protein [Bailinhaonella thermotolerans]|uniref:Uncharacterized protein n=1 Tax=Bailinhaonella thermotolerans TaxID=1070861 RepID=A0A3A4A4N9_9ACTN|nr:hypothetical protein [Bailinhaonella thermotolerans]RJL19245.1 hypothetical protein D5H75_40580 [Bailinhaonella thermotolerans]